MSLDQVIQPEILNDEFHQVIYQIAATQPIKHILEIGSSSGEGSTDAWVRGITHNPSRPTLHCIELSKPRFQALQSHYINNQQVKCYWASSIGVEFFPKESEVSDFYWNTPSKLREYPLESVISWLREDIEYVRAHQAPADGIEQALRVTGQTAFDAVLIDGSEFTGVPEFARIYGAKFILLDDIMTYKNWDVLSCLRSDTRYKMILSRSDLRNGFAVFMRV